MTYPVRLHTRVWNPDAPRRALLLHGLGSDGATIWRLADRIADRGWRVVAPDLRGHGLSPCTATYPLAGYVADVAALGTGWDLVVGHSLGGSILTPLLSDRSYAGRAVLIDPVLTISRDAVADLIAGQVTEVGGRLTADDVRTRHPDWHDQDVVTKVRASATVSEHVVRRTFGDENLPWDLTAAVEAWVVPTHVLVADPALGALVSPSEARWLAGLGIDVTKVDGAGHSIHRDAPQAVATAVDRAQTGIADPPA